MPGRIAVAKYRRQVAAPEAERDFFKKPAEFRKMQVRLGDRFTIHGASFVRPPIQPIPLHRGLRDKDTFTWRGHEFLCLDTRGSSPGGMSYLLKRNDRWLAFSGNVMLDGAKMHTWFDTEWDYGFAAGIKALRKSVALLTAYPLDGLLPSHGPVVTRLKEQLGDFGNKLELLEKLYVRGYGVEGASVAYQDKVSKPTLVPDVAQVSPHLFKFRRKNLGPTSA